MFENSGTADTYSIIPKGKEKRTWTVKSILRTKPPAEAKWPNPQLSVGRHRSSLGNLNFWDIEGPATSLTPLKNEVKILFDKHVDHLKPDPKKDCSPIILFDLFMAGGTASTACPTLIIISADKDSRGKAIELVRQSKILEKPEYTLVLLAQCSKNPRYLNSRIPREIAMDLALDVGDADTLGRSVFVKRSDPKSSRGLRIYIPTQVPQSFKKATIGGFLSLTLANGETILAGMTVAHVFEPSPAQNAETNDSDSDDDPVDFEFDGPAPENYSEAPPVHRTMEAGTSLPRNTGKARSTLSTVFDATRHGMSKARKFIRSSKNNHSPSVSSIDISSTKHTSSAIIKENDSNLIHIGHLYASSATNASLKSDWALVRITTQVLGTPESLAHNLNNYSSPLESSKDSEVYAIVGSRGAIYGELCNSSTFLKLYNSSSFEETWTVQLRDKLAYGDSGSWIFGKKSGCIFGHIIAGDPETSLAHVSSADSVIDDIEQQLNCKVVIPAKHKLIATRKDGEKSALSSTEGGIHPESPHKDGSETEERMTPDPVNSFTSEPQPATNSHLNQLHLTTTRANQNHTSISGVPSSSVIGQNSFDGGVRKRERDRSDRDRGSVRTNEYFIPGDGIDREVITADITRYLGKDAVVRSGSYENPQTRRIQQGYFITTYRNLTKEIISDLKADSNRWEAERRVAMARRNLSPNSDPPRELDGVVRVSRPDIFEYRASLTHQSRQYWGPTAVEPEPRVPIDQYQVPRGVSPSYYPSYPHPHTGYENTLSSYSQQPNSYVAVANSMAYPFSISRDLPTDTQVSPQPQLPTSASAPQISSPSDPYFERSPHGLPDTSSYEDSDLNTAILSTINPNIQMPNVARIAGRVRERERERDRDDRQRRWRH